ncbi:MAG TPA: SMP-30/gluconolactonase/LRE family protein, partial [Candidatus Bathyarchaeia archaeon]|nr:SMP-30/gluconolactonase/LRE family protein [Candidatus Bathyarchaeia archaeon]
LNTWGTYGTDDGKFDTPSGIAIDKNGYIYVVDTNNQRIEKFTSDGQFLTKWGTLGADDGQFFRPIGIAIDSSGNVYVTDSGNSRVQKFTSNGQFLTKWGSNGTDDGQFLSPAGIAVDPAGNVYVSDSNPYNPSIQKFSIQSQTGSLTGQQNAVPEFGTTAIVALTVAIVSSLIFRFKFRIFH